MTVIVRGRVGVLVRTPATVVVRSRVGVVVPVAVRVAGGAPLWR